MSAPNVNVMINDATVRIYWPQDLTGTYYFYNVYWDTSSNMAGETLLFSKVPNQVDRYYSKNDIIFTFKRQDLSVGQDTDLWIRIKGVSKTGVEDTANPSTAKLIMGVSTKIAENNIAQLMGYDYTNNVWRKVRVDSDGKIDTV